MTSITFNDPLTEESHNKNYSMYKHINYKFIENLNFIALRHEIKYFRCEITLQIVSGSGAGS